MRKNNRDRGYVVRFDDDEVINICKVRNLTKRQDNLNTKTERQDNYK